MSNWKRQTTAIEAFITLFDQQEDCDFMFRIGSKKIGAHKAFLQARSEVLREVTSEWICKEKPLVISNMEYDVFRDVLRYIYSDEIGITEDNVRELLYAACCFKMDHLEIRCTKYLSQCLNSSNVSSYMTDAVEFKAVTLQEECCKVFSRDTHLVLANEDFLELSQPALSAFLDAEEISVLEMEVFMGVYKWMVEQCKREGLPENGESMRQVIGDALYKIHFPTMSVQDFSNRVTTVEGLLTDTEIAQTFRKMSANDSDKVSCPFLTKFRSVLTPKSEECIITFL